MIEPIDPQVPADDPLPASSVGGTAPLQSAPQRLWPPHVKPAECEGCVRFRTGRGFVPGTGRLDSILLVIGEQPGTNEIAEGRPFVGRSGEELGKGLGSLGRDAVFITNVRKCLGPAGETPVERAQSIAHCARAFLSREMEALTHVRTTLAIGNDALQIALGGGSVVQLHGSVFTEAERQSIKEAHDDREGNEE